MTGRIPPHSVEAEEGVIGALLLRPSLLPDVLGAGLQVDDFYSGKYGAAYAAILRLDRRGDAIDAVTVHGALSGIEPRPEPAELIAAHVNVPSADHAVTYARQVLELAQLRRILYVTTEITDAGFVAEATGDVAAFSDWAEQTLLAATQTTRSAAGPALLAESADAAIDEIRARSEGRLLGVPTGLGSLDRLTGGLRPGQLMIVGARPSVGKSALLLGMALHIAERVGPVLLCSAEMGAVELATRALAGGGVPSDHLLTGRLGNADLDRLEGRRDAIARLPLLIDDDPAMTLASIRTRARRQASTGGLAAVMVDYLQLIPGDGRKERRELEVAEISRGCKAMARELHIPLVAAAQLNRAVELRADKRPVLADLRDSGQLEQDADLVSLLHRPYLYDLNANPNAAELIVAKHRNGPTGTVPLSWIGHRMTFVDASPGVGS